MTTTPLPPSEGWELDYDKLIADAFANHKYRQGTRECVAFKNGAHWAMHNYATQARADLEAEVVRLRAQMQTIKDYAGNPEIVWKTAVAALESKP